MGDKTETNKTEIIKVPPGDANLTRRIKKIAKERGVHIGDEVRWGGSRSYGYFPKIVAYRVPRDIYEAAVASLDIDWSARYPDWRAALKDACDSMFLLNRHAKKIKDASDIYELKNDLVRILWDHGYCVRAGQAESPDKKVECRRCDGTGEDPYEFDECQRCDGTGNFTIYGRTYWSFHFLVDGQPYSWHQPSGYAHWAKEVGEPIDQHDVLAVYKPTKKFKIADAKSLVAWVIEQADENDDDEDVVVD